MQKMAVFNDQLTAKAIGTVTYQAKGENQIRVTYQGRYLGQYWALEGAWGGNIKTSADMPLEIILFNL